MNWNFVHHCQTTNHQSIPTVSDALQVTAGYMWDYWSATGGHDRQFCYYTHTRMHTHTRNGKHFEQPVVSQCGLHVL